MLLAVVGVARCSCGPAVSEGEGESTLLEELRGHASAMDVLHGIARRAADCTVDPEPFEGCSDVYRVASISFEVDWAPEGLYLPVGAPAFEVYGIGQPGNFPVQGPGYLSAYRWAPRDGQDFNISCGDVVIPDGQARTQPVLRASDDDVAESGFTHEELRAAIQEGTEHRANDLTEGQLGGCPDCPASEVCSE
ncbi:MAG: hypothetical protein IT382_01580 [Deltaproteobacteria bacterium]|nr:hypothetical protein [Deltaproteobacteria bacterium]